MKGRRRGGGGDGVVKQKRNNKLDTINNCRITTPIEIGHTPRHDRDFLTIRLPTPMMFIEPISRHETDIAVILNGPKVKLAATLLWLDAADKEIRTAHRQYAFDNPEVPPLLSCEFMIFDRVDGLPAFEHHTRCLAPNPTSQLMFPTVHAAAVACDWDVKHIYIQHFDYEKGEQLCTPYLKAMDALLSGRLAIRNPWYKYDFRQRNLCATMVRMQGMSFWKVLMRGKQHKNRDDVLKDVTKSDAWPAKKEPTLTTLSGRIDAITATVPTSSKYPAGSLLVRRLDGEPEEEYMRRLENDKIEKDRYLAELDAEYEDQDSYFTGHQQSKQYGDNDYDDDDGDGKQERKTMDEREDGMNGVPDFGAMDKMSMLMIKSKQSAVTSGPQADSSTQRKSYIVDFEDEDEENDEDASNILEKTVSLDRDTTSTGGVDVSIGGIQPFVPVNELKVINTAPESSSRHHGEFSSRLVSGGGNQRNRIARGITGKKGDRVKWWDIPVFSRQVARPPPAETAKKSTPASSAASPNADTSHANQPSQHRDSKKSTAPEDAARLFRRPVMRTLPQNEQLPSSNSSMSAAMRHEPVVRYIAVIQRRKVPGSGSGANNTNSPSDIPPAQTGLAYLSKWSPEHAIQDIQSNLSTSKTDNSKATVSPVVRDMDVGHDGIADIASAFTTASTSADDMKHRIDILDGVIEDPKTAFSPGWENRPAMPRFAPPSLNRRSRPSLFKSVVNNTYDGKPALNTYPKPPSAVIATTDATIAATTTTTTTLISPAAPPRKPH